MAVFKPGQLSPWGSCLPGQLSYLGSCPTWAVVLPGHLSTWAVVTWAVVCLGSCRLGSCPSTPISSAFWVKKDICSTAQKVVYQLISSTERKKNFRIEMKSTMAANVLFPSVWPLSLWFSLQQKPYSGHMYQLPLHEGGLPQEAPQAL